MSRLPWPEAIYGAACGIEFSAFIMAHKDVGFLAFCFAIGLFPWVIARAIVSAQRNLG